jgi:tetratricopeptide (TPR) repeat protein
VLAARFAPAALFLFLVGASIALSPADARAQSTAKAADLQAARDLFAKALKDEAAKDWPAALEKLERAAAVKNTPGLRFHIALCKENLGRLAAALDGYTEAEAQARAEKNQEVLDAVAESLTQLRPRVPVITVTVPAGIEGIEASVDQKAVAIAPEGGYSLRVDPGKHEIDVKAPGRMPFHTSADVAEGATVTLHAPLEQPPAPAAPAAIAPPPANESAAPHRTAAIAFTAGAVVLAGAGVGAYLAADKCPATGSCENERSAVRTWDAVALGSWIGAAAAGGIAIYLWLKPTSHATTTGARSIRAEPWGTGLRLQGRF